MSRERRDWYAAKQFGWGWTPARWQGWLVTGLLLLAMFLPAHWLVRSGYRHTYLAYVGALVLVQVVICYFKGPAPRWRWGEPDR